MGVLKAWIRREWFGVFLFCSSCLLFANTLSGGYVWDDRAAIIGNKDVTQERSIRALFTNDFWGQDILHNWSHKSYRPVTTLSFRANHAVHGLNAAGYHLANVIIYAICVVLMYKMCRQWASSEAAARIASLLFCAHPVHVEAVASLVGRADSLCGLFFMAAMIVYSNSMQQWVPNASNGGVTMGVWWFVFALLLAVLASLSKEIGVTIFGMVVVMEVAHAIRQRKLVDALRGGEVRVLNAADASGSSDSHSAGPANGGVPNRQFMHGFRMCLLGVKDVILRPFAPAQIRSAFVVVFLCLMSMLRVRFNGPRSLYQWSNLENHINLLPALKDRALSYAQSHFWYLMKLIYPRHLCFDYGYACIPTVHSFADPRNLLPIAAYSLLGGVVYNAIRRAHVSLLIGLALFLVPLVPALNFLFPVGTTLAERLLFVPSAGFCLIVAEALTNLNALLQWCLRTRNKSHKLQAADVKGVGRASHCGAQGAGANSTSQSSIMFRGRIGNAYAFTCAVCLLFAARVLSRNMDWNSESQIYASALRVCPLSAKALTNYAVLHNDLKHSHNAAAAALSSVEIFDNQAPAWINAGVVQQRIGYLARSAWYYEQAILQNRGSGRMWGYLGSVLYEWSLQAADKQHHEAAIASMRKYAAHALDHAIANGFSPPSTLHSRGSLAMDQGDTALAIASFERALQLTAENKAEAPDVPKEDQIDEALTLNQLGTLYSGIGNFDEAIRTFERGLQQKPDDMSLLVNEGVALRALGRLNEARIALERAIDLEKAAGVPPSVALLNNLGLVDLDSGRLDEAEAMFEQALQAYEFSVNQDDAVRGNGNRGPTSHFRVTTEVQGSISDVIKTNVEKVKKAQTHKKKPAHLLL